MTLPIVRTNLFHKIIVITLILALFVGRKVNISYALTGLRFNNYLDIVLDFRYVVLVLLTLACFVFVYGLKQWITLYIGLMALLVGYVSFFQAVIFHRIERLVLIVSVGIGIYGSLYFISKHRYLRLVSLITIASPLLFDHFLVSESSGAFFLIYLLVLSYFIKQNNKLFRPMVYSLLIFLGLQSTIAFLQILTGRSIGFNFLGEAVFDIQNQKGLAAEVFSGNKFLRGYGLFVHPNIAGFVGSVSLLFFTMRSELSLRLQRVGWLLGGLVVLLSFSRVAWISSIFIITFILGKSKVSLWIKYVVLVCTSLVTASIFFFRFRLSDIYRFADIQTFFAAYLQTSLNQKLFGLGLGGYPFYLQNSFLSYEVWQFQPVHNVPLLLIIELGIVPTIGVLFLLYVWQKLQNSK